MMGLTKVNLFQEILLSAFSPKNTLPLVLRNIPTISTDPKWQKLGNLQVETQSIVYRNEA